MKKTYLFPPACKKIGLWIFIPFAALGFCMLFDIWIFDIWNDPQWELPLPLFALIDDSTVPTYYFKVVTKDATATLLVLGLGGSLLLLCFSREKDEDEYVAGLRCRTLVIAVIASYAILLIGNLFVYNLEFITFMFLNIFTVLLLYAAMFNYRLYKFRKSARDEE